jgi:FixJ family two-component response regulator
MGTLLLVEDNFLVGQAMCMVLDRIGWGVVGPVPSLKRGLAAAAAGEIDGAILDVRIVGGSSAPIAATLRERGCPFFFVTGYSSPDLLPPELRSVPRFSKPVNESTLRAAIERQFLQGRARANEEDERVG